MSSLEALRYALAGIHHKLTRIESGLGTATKEIEAKLKALDSLLQKDRKTSSSAVGTPSLAAGLQLTRIKKAFEKLAVSTTQDQILDTYLQEAQSFADRGILFLKSDNQYVTWKAIGFPLEDVPSASTQEQDNPIAQAASHRRIVVPAGDLDQTFPWLKQSGELPQAVLCIPLVFEDFVPVVLYVDSFKDIPIDSLELLTNLTILVLKNQYLQALIAREPVAESERSDEEPGPFAKQKIDSH